MNDTAEVKKLRARVAELEDQVGTGGTPPGDPDAPRGRSRWWGVGSAILLVLACLLAPFSVSSVWASTQLSDTDRYVETVAPLADNSEVQAALADEVSTVIFENLDIQGLTTELFDALAQSRDLPPRVETALPALAVPLANGIESFTRTQVEKFLASDEFAQVWEQVNRVAHEQVVRLLEGGSGLVTADENAITINLGPIVEEVKNRLVDQGFELASRIPAVDRSFVLVQSGALSDAQSFYGLLNTLGTWLPFIVAALFAGGVILARDKRRALVKGALGITAAMLVLGAALTLFRVLYIETTPADILTKEGAGDVFDTLVRFLRDGLRATGTLALVVALAAFVTGPSSAAVRVRRTTTGGIGSLRGGAEAAGWQLGGVGTWTYSHKRILRITVLALAGVALMLWTRPTVGVVIVTALVALLALGIIEFLGRPPSQLGGPALAGPTLGDEPPPTTAPTQRAAGEEASPRAGEGVAQKDPSKGSSVHPG